MNTQTKQEAKRGDNVQPATVGTTFTMRMGNDINRPYTVAAKCAKNVGQWICITHKTVFRNQFDKDGHIHDRKRQHVLAWICLEHGVEVP